jgi:hypothetical protein
MWGAVKDLFTGFWDWVGEQADDAWAKARGLFAAFWKGAIEKFGEFLAWGLEIPGKILNLFVNVVTWLYDTGFNLIVGFKNGAIEKWNDFKSWLWDRATVILDYVTELAGSLYDTGRAVIQGLWDGMTDVWDEVTGWLSNLNPANWFNDINLAKGHAEKNLVPTGLKVMHGLEKGMKQGWRTNAKWLEAINPSEHIGTTGYGGFGPQPVVASGSSSQVVNIQPGAVQVAVGSVRDERDLDIIQGLVDESFQELRRELQQSIYRSVRA